MKSEEWKQRLYMTDLFIFNCVIEAEEAIEE